MCVYTCYYVVLSHLASLHPYTLGHSLFQDSEEGGKTALHVLCGTENASINVFNALLNCNHNARLPTYKEDTTLHLAVKKENNEIVAELMKKYPDMVNYVDKFGFTPVHVAVAYQNEKALNIFIKLILNPITQ